MSIEEIRQRESGPRAFFERDVPELHEELRELFSSLSTVPVRFHISFDELGVEYTVELRPEGVGIVEGPMVEFPLFSLQTDVTEWDVVREHTFDLLEAARRRLVERVDLSSLTTLDADILEAFERFDGIIELALTVPEVQHPLDSTIILNDYEPFGDPKSFRLELDIDTLYRVARAQTMPADAFEPHQVSGSMSLAFDLGGFLVRQFPSLSES